MQVLYVFGLEITSISIDISPEEVRNSHSIALARSYKNNTQQYTDIIFLRVEYIHIISIDLIMSTCTQFNNY